jgi:sn-glycerol 3-phosphate transport system ATP-binding protein
MATLELNGLRKSFGLIDVLHGIDLALADGEMLVIVGASGCGKSTLLRLVAGLERPTSGRVLVDGRDVTNLDPSERDIAMVFQNYALYPHMSVFDNMAYGLRIRGLSRAARSGRSAGAEATAALRRPAAARRDGACDRASPEAVPVRRAAVQPGRQAAPDDACGDTPAAASAGRHQSVRDT